MSLRTRDFLDNVVDYELGAPLLALREAPVQLEPSSCALERVSFNEHRS